MAFDYSSLDTVARELIADFGQAATLRRITGATYDPVTGSASGGTTTNTSVTTVLVGIDKAYAEANAGSIEAGDQMALLDSQVEPLLSDTLIVGSDHWQVQAVIEVNPGGTALLYKAHVRR